MYNKERSWVCSWDSPEWRSRHFTAVTALGPQKVELEHSKVVVSCCCSFMSCLGFPPEHTRDGRVWGGGGGWVAKFVTACVSHETGNLDISENPYGAPRPTESPNLPKQQKRYFRNPKSSIISPRVNVISPKVNVKYFSGILDEDFQVFEIFCWGFTVTGVSKIAYPKSPKNRVGLFFS